MRPPKVMRVGAVLMNETRAFALAIWSRRQLPTDQDSQEDLTRFKVSLDNVPTEELRLALVLNGGVSLAVWMGGVAHEINRLTHSRPDSTTAYGPILAAARATTTVDIISGTSAGGINGTALALAQVNKRADLLALRTLWAEQGRMEDLLRRPFQGKPTSMLRGDEYFLPELNRAMRMLAFPFEAHSRFTPMDLTLTTTLLKGAQKVTVDDFGQRIPERIHAGTFQFTNLTEDGPPSEGKDPFGKDQIEHTARAMALAARCTASFPFAFEPSFVPVGEEPGSDDLRTDMGEFASWKDLGTGPQSRYTVDGGVLANTPLSHALEAIRHRQADGPVRRAMLLVFPHAPQAEHVPPDKASEPPGAAGALSGVFSALQAQGSRSFVERIDKHNREAADWRGSREQLLDGFGQGDPVPRLYDMLTDAWPHYRHIRIRIAARGLADKVAKQEQWSYERIREAAESAQRSWLRDQDGNARNLPYVPADFRFQEPAWLDSNIRAQDQWSWGDSGALGVAEAAASVLRAALSVAPRELQQALSEARTQVGEHIVLIRTARKHLDAIWTTNEYLRDLAPTTDYWSARIIAYGAAMLPNLDPELLGELDRLLHSDGAPEHRAAALAELKARDGADGGAVATAVRAVVRQLTGQQAKLESIAGLPVGADDVSGVQRWCRFLYGVRVGGEPANNDERVLLRLLALDAATRLMAADSTTGADLPVKLAELSLRLAHPWAQFSISPDDKAAGLELARFGGFLKRSWRMNDWTWGRLDAITLLCQTVLDPQRLRRVSTMAAPQDPEAVASAIFSTLENDLYGTASLPAALHHLREQAREELKRALTTDPDVRHLPNLARWAALPLQAEVLLEELPVLAAAINVDVEDGAGKPTRGTRFLADRADLLVRVAAAGAAPSDAVTSPERLALGYEALRAFDSAGIGREPLSEETGSNALIRTASNAAGVMATVLDGDASHTPAVKPVTSALRGAMMLPHWVVAGLAGGGSIARFLATAGLVIGGLFLALSLFGVLGSLAAAAGLAGAATLLTALAYSALKTGSLLHACALLAPVAPLTAYALDSTKGSTEAATRVLIVLAAVTALYVLANIPWPLVSPISWLIKHFTRRWVAAGLVTLVVLLASWLVWYKWHESITDTWAALAAADHISRAVDQFNAHVILQFVGIGVVFLVGACIAYFQGAMLRTWRPKLRTETTYDVDHVIVGSFRRETVRNPAGVAASWAPVYGLGYLLAAWVIGQFAHQGTGRETWEQFTLWWFAALGILLCLLAPFLVARLPRDRVRTLIRRSWQQVTPLPTSQPEPGATHFLPKSGDDHQKLLYALLKYDMAFCYLIRGDGNWWVRNLGRPRNGTRLALTHRGHRLQKQLDQGRFEIVMDRAGTFHWRLTASSGRVILSSQSYSKKGDAKKAAKAVRKVAPGASVEHLTDRLNDE